MVVAITVLVIGKNTYNSNLDICLTARALGASETTIVDKPDRRLVRYMNNLRNKWGGKFKVKFSDDYKSVLKQAIKYKKVYLTRFGMPLNKLSYSIKTYKNIMLIVTVSEAYRQIDSFSDFNISITGQQHCSAAAIAVFLHEFYGGRELAIRFENARLKVIPKEHGIAIERVKT